MRTALNETLRTRLRRVIGKAAFALVLAGAVGALGAPAMAQEWHGDRGYGDRDGWRAREQHERWEQRERWEHRYWHPEYRPQVYYAPPPPVYYAPPPAYYRQEAYRYSQPSLSVVIPFGDR